MFWIIGIIVFIILGAILTQKGDSLPHDNRNQCNDLTEEIEYNYLQRQQEEQDEEDYYLQQQNKK